MVVKVNSLFVDRITYLSNDLVHRLLLQNLECKRSRSP